MIWLVSALFIIAVIGWWRTWIRLQAEKDAFRNYAYRMRRELPGDEAMRRPGERAEDHR